MADKKKHQDYWTKRVDEIIRYADQIDIDVFAEIARIYLEEAKLVQKELFAFYQRFADDNGLTLQEAMYQLRHEDLSDYQQNAKQYFEQAEKDPELLKRLNEQYASARATRMDLLNLELTWRAGVLATSISSTFENHLLKIAKYAYRKAGDRRGTINEPALRELVRTPINGKNYSEHIWGNVDKLAEDLREVLRRGFIRGLNPREMAQEITKKYNVARSRAQTVVRTDGTAIISNSVAKRYLDAGLKYYRILVHLDDRTTDICRQIAKEDKLYELSEMKAGLNAPPFHYNCRSGIVPDEVELQSDKYSDMGLLLSDIKSLWDRKGITGLDRGEIERWLMKKYELGRLPNSEILGKFSGSKVIVQNHFLSYFLTSHEGQLTLSEIGILKDTIESPDLLAEDIKSQDDTFLLFRKNGKYIYDAIVTHRDGQVLIHFTKRNKKKGIKRIKKVIKSGKAYDFLSNKLYNDIEE